MKYHMNEAVYVQTPHTCVPFWIFPLVVAAVETACGAESLTAESSDPRIFCNIRKGNKCDQVNENICTLICIHTLKEVEFIIRLYVMRTYKAFEWVVSSYEVH